MAAFLEFHARLLFGICLSSIAFSSELIHLSNGFSLQAESHVQSGDLMKFSVGGGTLEFPVNQISAIETIASPIQNNGVSPDSSEVKPDMLVSKAAIKQGIDAAFVRSVAKIESGMRQASFSAKGAVGLMQLMPGTAKQLGVDSSQPDQNARGGAQYLRNLLVQYKGNSALALAAYNAGPGAIQRFRGIPPYRETQQYVVRVLQEYNRQLLRAASGRKAAKKPSATN